MRTDGSTEPAGESAQDDWASWGLTQSNKVILVADLVESVRLMEEDEALTVKRWRAFMQKVTGQILPEHKGRLVKSLGDGLMVEFDHARAANLAAQALHQAAAQVQTQQPSTKADHYFALRIGAHAAEVFRDEHDIYGAGVNLAARIATLAQPGETVVTSEVRDALTDGLDANVRDLGECYLKHVVLPVRAWAVAQAPTIGPSSAARDDTLAELTLAILPFETEPNTQASAVSQLMADALNARLRHCRRLRLISRLSCAALPPGRADSFALKSLGAAYVVSGRLMLLGEQIVLTYEVARFKDMSIVDAGRCSCAVVEVCAAASDAIDQLAESLHAAVTRSELELAAHSPLPNLPSATLALAGISWMHRSSKHDFERAERALQAVLVRHNRHAGSLAWLSNWHALRLTQGMSPDPMHDAGQCDALVSRALSSDPDCSMAWAIRGAIGLNIKHDLAYARESLQNAVACDPNNPTGWHYKSLLHAFCAEGKAALQASERALRLSPLDPLNSFWFNLAATAHLGAGQWQHACELAQRALRGSRTHASTFRSLIVAQAMSGDLDAARASASEFKALHPNYRVSHFKLQSGFRLGPHLDGFARALREAGIPD